MEIINDNIKLSLANIVGNCRNDFPKLNQLLKFNEPLNCLDLGCRFPKTLIHAYHQFNCDKLVGVDKKSEKDCVDSFIKQYASFYFKNNIDIKSSKSFFDLYSKVFKIEQSSKPQITNKQLFDTFFTNNIKRDYVSRFLKNNTQKYDLIILSNLLHLIPKKERRIEILKETFNSLSESGILLIRVQSKSKFNYSEFKKELFGISSKIEIYEHYTNNNWKNSIIINQSGLLKSDKYYKLLET